MMLCPGWLPAAKAFMDERADIGCLTGLVIDRPLDAGDPAGLRPARNETDISAQEILSSGGAALYRRSVLEEVGPFNPFFVSDEEPELCLRIRHAGHKVILLGIPVAYHFTAASDQILSIFSRRQRSLHLGMGQIMRHYLGKPLFWNYVFERGYACSAAIAILLGAILAYLSIAKQTWFWLGFAVIASVGDVCFDALRKKSLHRTFLSTVKRLIILEGTLYGFLMPPHAPGRYPARVDVLKTMGK
jgi:GT2 family glycosyltransferase